MLPPLSNLEVTSGPKMVAHKGKTIVVFQMQLNVNLKIMKREEHEGNRKGLHLAGVTNTYLELRRDLRNKCLQIKDEERVLKGNSADSGKQIFNQSKNYQVAEKISESIMQEVDELVTAQDSRNWKWYNDDRNYKLALEEVALLKEMALAKFSWWKETPTVAKHNVDQLSMLQVLKQYASKNYHSYCLMREKFDFQRYDRDRDDHIDFTEFTECLSTILCVDVQEVVTGARPLWEKMRTINIHGDASKLTREEFAQIKKVLVKEHHVDGKASYEFALPGASGLVWQPFELDRPERGAGSLAPAAEGEGEEEASREVKLDAASASGGRKMMRTPSNGRLLVNEKLANALKSKCEFTQEEWDAFGITVLNLQDYIRSGDRYYRPVPVTQDDGQTQRELGAPLKQVWLLAVCGGRRDRCSLYSGTWAHREGHTQTHMHVERGRALVCALGRWVCLVR